ncbi:hypothetical protein [Spirosoma endophyticum]|uniref:Uncharacterized protein n=1 Tax=Spirosoma endophyticum TaxID=662367 RepID=A0A1I1HKM2_9BACT|nr:hypothetical protein [Spirosoma endophyticum]SFC24102.1 hypothetical protein SAMN05216167_101720 [Spirosoma endophyticum]
METLDTLLTIAYVVVNIFSVTQLIGTYRWPATTRVLFFLLFSIAAFVNIRNALETPWVYQSYADYAIPIYRRFILGLFDDFTIPIVLSIGVGQILIAFSMFIKGDWFRMGCLGGLVFCVAIAPLGLGSGFPSSLLFALAFYRLYQQQNRKPTNLIRSIMPALVRSPGQPVCQLFGAGWV